MVYTREIAGQFFCIVLISKLLNFNNTSDTLPK